jgi:hypothetical protein
MRSGIGNVVATPASQGWTGSAARQGQSSGKPADFKGSNLFIDNDLQLMTGRDLVSDLIWREYFWGTSP